VERIVASCVTVDNLINYKLPHYRLTGVGTTETGAGLRVKRQVDITMSNGVIFSGVIYAIFSQDFRAGADISG
jgi:hypothetical protein